MQDSEALYSEDAEQAILGLMLHNNDNMKPIRDVVRPEHFFQPVHSTIFKHIQDGVSGGKIVCPITLQKTIGEQIVDFPDYLSMLVDIAPHGAAIAEYGQMVIDLAVRREMKSLYERGAGQVDRNYDHTAHELLDGHLSELVRIQRQGTGQAKFASTQDAVDALLSPDRPVTIETGFKTLDTICQLPRGAITLLGGRASMGKSAVMIEMAFNAARRGVRVDLFSMEMNRQQIAARAISSQLAREGNAIAYRDIYEGRYHPNRKADIVDCARSLPKINFDDTPRLSVSDIKARCADRSDDMGIIFIDYLNIMSLHDCTEADRHDQKLGLVCSKLRDFAKDTNSAVVLLCQLNRGASSRDSNVPMLHDLRDSGELEQHADTVLFVHREHYYLKRKIDALRGTSRTITNDDLNELDNCERDVDLIVAKQRMGEIGKITLHGQIENNLIMDRKV